MKAEEYIAHNTRNGNNMIYYHNHNFTHGTDYVEGSGIEVTYTPWVTPENALVAVAIAKNELMDKACEFINQLCDGFSIKDNIMGLSYSKEELLKDFCRTMEETNNEIK